MGSGERIGWALATCALAASLSACSSSDKPDAAGKDSGPLEPEITNAVWPILGFDPASTYFNRNERTISVDNAHRLEVAWSKSLGRNLNGAPIQIGNRIYATGTKVVAMDARNGNAIWEERIYSTAAAAYDDGTLYIHDGNGNLHALDAANGETKWTTDVSEQENAIGFSSPIVAGDLVIVGGSTASEVSPPKPTFRGSVTAVNKESGKIAWMEYTVPEDATGASLWSSVAIDVAESRVYAATGNNYTEPATDSSDAILALNYATGAVEWKSQRYEGDVWSIFAASLGNPDADFGANPVLYEAEVDGEMTALVAAGQKSGDMHGMRRDTGDLVWTRKLGPGNASGSAGIFNNTTWAGDRLLVACNSATSSAPGSEARADGSTTTAVLFALDGGTGDIIWERQLPGEVMASVTVANGVGFVGTGHILEAFNVETGELLKSITTDATIACAPTVANGRVAFGNGLSWSFGTPGTTFTVLELN